jgi:SAM-dependent methyltransferase
VSGRTLSKVRRFLSPLSATPHSGNGSFFKRHLIKKLQKAKMENETTNNTETTGSVTDLKGVELPEDYASFNSKVIDEWVEEGWEWGTPVSHETIERARHGDWAISLAPRNAPREWFEPYLDSQTHLFPFKADGQPVKVLGLAAGGGQQSAILAAAGADVTVFDYSDSQIESDRALAEREGYEIEVVKGDMSKPLPFDNESFDIIVNPVSNVYIEEVRPLWRECYRILRHGGLLLAGLDDGFQYLFDYDENDNAIWTSLTWSLPVNPLRNPEQRARWNAKADAIQFSHTFEEQVGGQCEAGFVITAVQDAFNSDEEKKFPGFPTYVQTRAAKM